MKAFPEGGERFTGPGNCSLFNLTLETSLLLHNVVSSGLREWSLLDQKTVICCSVRSSGEEVVLCEVNYLQRKKITHSKCFQKDISFTDNCCLQVRALETRGKYKANQISLQPVQQPNTCSNKWRKGKSDTSWRKYKCHFWPSRCQNKKKKSLKVWNCKNWNQIIYLFIFLTNKNTNMSHICLISSENI